MFVVQDKLIVWFKFRVDESCMGSWPGFLPKQNEWQVAVMTASASVMTRRVDDDRHLARSVAAASAHGPMSLL